MSRLTTSSFSLGLALWLAGPFRLLAAQASQSTQAEPWDIATSELGDSDTGAILTGGSRHPFNGFGFLRLTVQRPNGAILASNEILRGFGIIADGGTSWRSTRPVVRAGVLIERGLLAPPNVGYLRYFDTYTNYTAETRRVVVSFGGGIGWPSRRAPAVIALTSSRDRRLDRLDGWAVFTAGSPGSVNPPPRAPAALVFGSPGTAVVAGFGGGDRDPFRVPFEAGENSLAVRFQFVLPPGRSVSILTYAIRGHSKATGDRTLDPEVASLAATADSLLHSPDLSGLSRTDLRQVTNWRSPPFPRHPLAFGVSVVEAGIAELGEALAEERTSSEQLTKQYLARIAAYDRDGPRLNAMIHLNERALERARELDQERTQGRVRGPLHGIPIILKDNYNTKDMPTSVGSLALAGLTPPRDAAMVTKLREGGAVFLGKANMDEFGWGNATVSGVIGQTKNAYLPDRSAAGSSGGSATAAAASFAAFTMGTDACNSLSFPAALASLVALRATAGRLDLDGIAPGLPLQDVAGPMTRSVADLVLVLGALGGLDSAGRPEIGAGGLRGSRLGVFRQIFSPDTVDPGVDRVIGQALLAARQAGATVLEVTIPEAERLLSESSGFNVRGEFGAPFEEYLRSRPELPFRTNVDLAASPKVLPRHRGMFTRIGRRADGTEGSIGFGGNSLNLEARARVIAARNRYRAALEEAMDRERLDALVYPSNLAPAQLRDSPAADYAGGTCEPSAHTGLPQLTIPTGWIADGLAVGLQLLGRMNDEARLLRLGSDFERLTGHRRRPATTP